MCVVVTKVYLCQAVHAVEQKQPDLVKKLNDHEDRGDEKITGLWSNGENSFRKEKAIQGDNKMLEGGYDSPENRHEKSF